MNLRPGPLQLYPLALPRCVGAPVAFLHAPRLRWSTRSGLVLQFRAGPVSPGPPPCPRSRVDFLASVGRRGRLDAAVDRRRDLIATRRLSHDRFRQLTSAVYFGRAFGKQAIELGLDGIKYTFDGCGVGLVEERVFLGGSSAIGFSPNCCTKSAWTSLAFGAIVPALRLIEFRKSGRSGGMANSVRMRQSLRSSFGLNFGRRRDSVDRLRRLIRREILGDC